MNNNIFNKIMFIALSFAGISFAPSLECIIGTGGCLSGCAAFLHCWTNTAQQIRLALLLAATPGIRQDLPDEEALKDHVERQVVQHLQRHGSRACLPADFFKTYEEFLSDGAIKEIVDSQRPVARDNIRIRNEILRNDPRTDRSLHPEEALRGILKHDALQYFQENAEAYNISEDLIAKYKRLISEYEIWGIVNQQRDIAEKERINKFQEAIEEHFQQNGPGVQVPQELFAQHPHVPPHKRWAIENKARQRHR